MGRSCSTPDWLFAACPLMCKQLTMPSRIGITLQQYQVKHERAHLDSIKASFCSCSAEILLSTKWIFSKVATISSSLAGSLILIFSSLILRSMNCFRNSVMGTLVAVVLNSVLLHHELHQVLIYWQSISHILLAFPF